MKSFYLPILCESRFKKSILRINGNVLCYDEAEFVERLPARGSADRGEGGSGLSSAAALRQIIVQGEVKCGEPDYLSNHGFTANAMRMP